MTNSKPKSRLKRFLGIFGPGLVTGAADDDPSGLATYSQSGAQFGYAQLWIVPFLYPMMVAVQEACARIGAVTKKGIAAVAREHYGKPVLITTVALIAIANTVNIGADIGAMAAALELILPIPFVLSTLGFTVITLLCEIYVPYKAYARVLKWLAASLLVYPLTLFLISQPWGTLLRATFIPNIELSFVFLFLFIGVIGTTISPYMFFWQASEEVEEEIELNMDQRKSGFKKFIRNMRIDNAMGMLFSQIITWCIIVVTGTVLHANGITNIATAADAAKALAPLAGSFAGTIFAIGIIGLGLLGVPVLAGSAAYAMAEAFNWHEGLYRKLRDAHGFYTVIIVATVIGLGINFIGIDPIKALIVTAVLNGIVAIPLLFLIIKISSSKKIMNEYASGWLSRTVLWITFIAMIVAAVGMFWQMG